MSITLTSEMKVELVQHMGGDAMAVAAARVSTRGQLNEVKSDPDEGDKLIRYLMKFRHGTPFEHGALTFFIHAPIFVWREFHRHRIGFSYNEESARYKQLDPVFFLPEFDRPMLKVVNWKAGRPKFDRLTNVARRFWKTKTERRQCVRLTN